MAGGHLKVYDSMRIFVIHVRDDEYLKKDNQKITPQNLPILEAGLHGFTMVFHTMMVYWARMSRKTPPKRVSKS